MSQTQFNIPVVLIIFNRCETLRRLLNVLSQIKPREIFVIADGPRTNCLDDKEACSKARELIDRVDWDCQIFREYSDTNLGCGRRPSSGITRAFEKFEQCIILEDDCIPDVSFFRFCKELLEKYKDDERIMMISGNHHLLKKVPVEASYFFSRNTITSGWATWRRAWQYYDFDMKLWPALKKTRWLERIWGSREIANHWRRLFEKCYQDKNRHYWDYQWTFACWAQNGLSVSPDRNLVSNIGFGQLGGSHYSGENCPFGNLPTYEMDFPLHHPQLFIPNLEADRQIQKDVYGQVSFAERINRKVKRGLAGIRRV